MIVTRTGQFKRSYAADTAVQRTNLQRIAFWGFVVALFVLVPRALSTVWINNVNQVLIAVVGVTGLNILLGYTGQISIGHGAFAGVGAFTMAVLNNRWHVPMLLGLPLGATMAAAIGLLVGIPSLRVKGLYLAVATLASQQILSWFFEHMEWLTRQNTSSVDVRVAWLQIPGIWNHKFKTDADLFYLFAVIALVTVLATENLMRSRIGRAFVAIRDREIAAEIAGVNAFAYKLLAFTISAFIAGIAGGMQALLFSRAQITPSQFDINLSINWLAMNIIGGLGSVPGAIYGATLLVLLPYELRNWTSSLKRAYPGVLSFHAHFALFDPGSWFDTLNALRKTLLSAMADRYAQIQDILFGAVIIGFLIFEPDGLNAIWLRVRRFFARWPFAA
jgi:branched-chain amino acid transport system permease protein